MCHYMCWRSHAALALLGCLLLPGFAMTDSVACIACASKLCRTGCDFDLGRTGNLTGQCVSCSSNGGQSPQPGVNYVHVDVPADVSSYNSMQLGINAISGSWCPCDQSQSSCNGPLNATDALHSLRPFFARAHDASLLNPSTFKANPPWGEPTLNWGDMFPSLAADPAEPASYQWDSADKWIETWDVLGIPVLMRLGTSFNSPAWMTDVSSGDVETLATVFVHFAMHFNDGWGGGRKARQKIIYWEVWNEPEGRFWQGSPEAFQKLLGLTIKKFREYDAELRIGPNNAFPYGENGGSLQSGYEFTALDAALALGAKPQIYSWHEYVVQYPTLTETYFNKTRAELAKRDLVDVEQIITEWNPCGTGTCVPPFQLDAWAAADFAQTALVHATLGVTMSAPYPLCATNNDWGLLSTATAPHLSWRPQAYAFQMISHILHEAPHAWQPWFGPSIRDSSGLDNKYFATALSSADRTRISVVYVARMQEEVYYRGELLVQFSGLSPGVHYRATAFVIDTSVRNNEQVGAAETVKVDSSGSLQLMHSYPASSPTVLHIKLEKVSSFDEVSMV